MNSKNLNVALYVFMCTALLGLWLITVGMFTSFVDINVLMPIQGMDGMLNDSIDVFDASWKMLDGASPLFLILSYATLIVGLVIVAVDATVRQKLKKRVNGLNFAGLAVAVVGFVLLITAMVITKNDVQTSMNKLFLALIEQSGETNGMTNQQISVILNMMFRYDLGMGSIMAIIGGVVALAGSILLVIPAFDPIKAAAQPATATQPANNIYTLPDNPIPESKGGGLSSVKPFDPKYAAHDADTTNNDTIA